MKKLPKARKEYIKVRLKEAALLKGTIEKKLNNYTDEFTVQEVVNNKTFGGKQHENWIYFEGRFKIAQEFFNFVITFQLIDQDLNSKNIHIIDNRIGLMVKKAETDKEKDYKWNLEEWLKAPTMYELPLNDIDREAIVRLIVSDKHRVDKKHDYFKDSEKHFNKIRKAYFDNRNTLFANIRIKLADEISKSNIFEGNVSKIAFGYHSYKGGAKNSIKYGLELRPHNLGNWRYFEGKIKYKGESWNFIITLNVIETDLGDVFGDTEQLGIMVYRNMKLKNSYTLDDWKESCTNLCLEQANGKILLEKLKEKIDRSKKMKQQV